MRRAGRGRHYIANRRVEAAAGVSLLVGGMLLLHDAYERRAMEQPLWLRPFAWW